MQCAQTGTGFGYCACSQHGDVTPACGPRRAGCIQRKPHKTTTAKGVFCNWHCELFCCAVNAQQGNTAVHQHDFRHLHCCCYDSYKNGCQQQMNMCRASLAKLVLSVTMVFAKASTAAIDVEYMMLHLGQSEPLCCNPVLMACRCKQSLRLPR